MRKMPYFYLHMRKIAQRYKIARQLYFRLCKEIGKISTTGDSVKMHIFRAFTAVSVSTFSGKGCTKTNAFLGNSLNPIALQKEVASVDF